MCHTEAAGRRAPRAAPPRVAVTVPAVGVTARQTVHLVPLEHIVELELWHRRSALARAPVLGAEDESRTRVAGHSPMARKTLLSQRDWLQA